MSDDPFAQKVKVTIPKVGVVMFPADLDPITVDQEARKLYMKAGAGRLPVRKGPPRPNKPREPNQ